MHKNILKYPSVAIIIVNWNGKKYLKDCLSSLQELLYPKQKLKIILVDNGSSDGSVSWVKKKYPKTIIIQNNENLGFAKANNIGISFALSKKEASYIVTLNNDTRVDQYWLKYLVDFMEKNKKVGIAVGKILQLYNRTKIDSAGDFLSKDNFRVVNRGHNERDQGQYNLPREIFSACAAASIFRRKTIEEVKINNEYFDEDFVSYIEDIDLNIRARLRNWLCFYVPKARIYHIGSATSSKMSREYKEYLSRRNRILFAIKNFPIKYMLLLVIRYSFPSYRGTIFYLKIRLGNILARRLKYRLKKGIKFHLEQGFRTYIKSNNNNLSVLEVSMVHIRALYGSLKLLPKIIKKRESIQDIKNVSNQEIERWFKELAI